MTKNLIRRCLRRCGMQGLSLESGTHFRWRMLGPQVMAELVVRYKKRRASDCKRNITSLSSNLTSAVSLWLVKLFLPGELLGCLNFQAFFCKRRGDWGGSCGLPGTNNIGVTIQNDQGGQTKQCYSLKSGVFYWIDWSIVRLRELSGFTPIFHVW